MIGIPDHGDKKPGLFNAALGSSCCVAFRYLQSRKFEIHKSRTNGVYCIDISGADLEMMQ